jgi:hypothetical protein
MPLAREAFVDGTLSETRLRLLADTWNATIAEVFTRDEALLLRWVTRLPHRDAKTVLAAWANRADPDRAGHTAQDRFDRRSFHLNELLDGMGRGDFLLDPEGTAIVREAITFLGAPVEGETRLRSQRQADALVTMAKFVLTHHDIPTGTKRRVPKVLATIDWESLATGTGVGTLEAGMTKPTVVPAETIRRIACDAGIHRYITNAPGSKLDYGRHTRTISDALFDVLTIRDHGCRWPGCTIPSALCEGHHAIHWEDHGETEPDNLLLLCWFHHHLLHEQHWSIQPLGAGHFQLTNPHGATQPLRPPLVGTALPVETTLR